MATLAIIILMTCLFPAFLEHAWAQSQEAAQGAPQTEDTLTWRDLQGVWKTYYVDEKLGAVHGEVVVEGQNIDLVLRHPETGQDIRSSALSAAIDGNALTLTFERPDLFPPTEDGQKYPGELLLTDEANLTSITITGGANDVAVPFQPMRETDQDHLNVRLYKLNGVALGGRWRYRVHPFLQRAEDGLGRAGIMDQDDEGVWWMTGLEGWQRPRPVIYGIVPIQDQLARETLSDGEILPYYEYPFSEKEVTNGLSRTLFVFGRDLPRRWNQSMDIKAGTPGIRYQEVARWSDFQRSETTREGYSPETAERDRAGDPFVRGRKIVEQRLKPDEQGQLADLEAVILEANLAPGVVPGWQKVNYGDAQGAWLLQFGDNTGRLRIVRKTDTQTNRYEQVPSLFSGEQFQVEIETKRVLPAASIPVIVTALPKGVPIEQWRKGGALLGDGSGIIAMKSPDNPRIYRTEFIRVDPRIPVGKSIAAGTTLTSGAKARIHSIHGASGSDVYAMISAPGVLSIPPAMAKAAIWKNPAHPVVAGNWTSWLSQAAQCAGVTTAGPQVTIERAEATRISRFLINSGSYPVAFPGWMENKVTVGQHAAMLLMRDTFIKQLQSARATYASIETDEELTAFRRAMEPFIRQEKSPLTRVPVIGIDGNSTDFVSTFNQASISAVHDSSKTDVEAWALKATREVLKTYVELMLSMEREKTAIGTFDIESLLKLTGHNFGAVAALAKAKLMRPAKAPLIWAPDYQARAQVDNVALTARQVRLVDELALTARREAELAVAVSALPVALVGAYVGSTSTMLATLAIDTVDVASATYSEVTTKLGRDAEYGFALAAADVTGMARLEAAELPPRSWASVMGQLFPVYTFAAFGLTADIPEAYKFYQKGMQALRIARGRQVLAKELQLDLPSAGAPSRLQDTDTAISTQLDQARLAQAADTAPQSPPPLRPDDPDLTSGLDPPSKPVEFRRVSDPLAETAEDIFAFLDDLPKSAIRSSLDEDILTAAERLMPEPAARAPWEDGLSAEGRQLAERLRQTRPDDLTKMADEGVERLVALIDNADPIRARYAREIIESEPLQSLDAIEQAVDTLYKRRPRDLGRAFFDQADPNNAEIEGALKAAGWEATADIAESYNGMNLNIRDPHGYTASLTREFDADKGYLIMEFARVKGRAPDAPDIDETTPLRFQGKIPDLLPVNNAGNAVPSIQFYQLRVLHHLGAAAPGAIKKVKMSTMANVRTITTMENLRRLYYPALELKDVPPEELSRWLMMTHSVRYGEGVMAGAGYRVTGASFGGDQIYKAPITGWQEFFNSPTETIQEFLRRYGMNEDTEATCFFDIILNVEPF
ncbi:MAG: hypothetical protein AAGI88_00220 [Pseudomonadota bacterium]